MKRHVPALAFASLFVLPVAAHGAALGNLTYTAQELEKPVSNFGGAGEGKFPSGPTGSNTVLMLKDVMVVVGSVDSGKPPLSFHMFDVKDPRNPKLLKSVVGTPELEAGREIHAMPLAMVNGKDILVFPSQTGITFFDFTDPLNPTPVGSLALSGVSGGDYDNAAWMLSWAYPYVYVGGTGNGVYIVDATDPAKPTLVTRIATGSIGNFRIGPVYAAGNYLVALGMDQVTTKVSVVDVSNPKAPFLVITGSTPASLYSAVVVGDEIYGPGTNGDYSFLRWSPTAITTVGTGKSGMDRGGYCTVQSGYVICGQSTEGYKKWDVRTLASPVLAGHGTDPAAADGDFDFATILGNLVYLGNDHGTGAALIPHMTAPDSTAPQVKKVYPSEGDTKQALTSRITIFFSEDVDVGTISATNVIVRKSGGTAIEGTFSKSSFNAISFGPKAALEANTTYEVVVPAGGVKDLVGNAIQTASTTRFATGATLAAGSGGAGGGATGGAGGGGGGAAAGSGGSGNGGSVGASGGAASGGTSGGTGGIGNGSGGNVVSGSGGATPGSGGSVGSTGGNVSAGSGGTTGSGGAGKVPMTSGGSSGCGCAVPGGAGSGGVLSFFAMALLARGWRTARRRRGSTVERS